MMAIVLAALAVLLLDAAEKATSTPKKIVMSLQGMTCFIAAMIDLGKQIT